MRGNNVPAATGRICGCGRCYCCEELVKETAREEAEAKARRAPLTEYEERVQRLLQPLTVPHYRRDVSEPWNVVWLIRNLGSENKRRSTFKHVIRELANLNNLQREWKRSIGFRIGYEK